MSCVHWGFWQAWWIPLNYLCIFFQASVKEEENFANTTSFPVRVFLTIRAFFCPLVDPFSPLISSWCCRFRKMDFSENKWTYFHFFMIWSRWYVFCCWFLLWFLWPVYLVPSRSPPRQYSSMTYRGFSLPDFCRHSISRSLQGRAFLSCIRDHDVEVLDVTRKFFTRICLWMIVERISTSR